VIVQCSLFVVCGIEGGIISSLWLAYFTSIYSTPICYQKGLPGRRLMALLGWNMPLEVSLIAFRYNYKYSITPALTLLFGVPSCLLDVHITKHCLHHLVSLTTRLQCHIENMIWGSSSQQRASIWRLLFLGKTDPHLKDNNVTNMDKMSWTTLATQTSLV
jgi:hypothetical protein